MKVGVFDSGIGGLSVVKSLLEHQLFEKIIYFGDTARVPYGSKDKNTIIRYGIEAVEFFKNFDIDLMIVACNSVSSYALKEMQESSKCPVFGVVDAGVRAAANALDNKDASILILGTKATIASQTYVTGLKQQGFTNLHPLATGLFVPLVEESIFDGVILESVMQHYFDQIKTPDAIILGCTHFPLIQHQIKLHFNNNPLLIHSGDAIVEVLENTYEFTYKFSNPTLEFFASENPEALKKTAHHWLDKT